MKLKASYKSVSLAGLKSFILNDPERRFRVAFRDIEEKVQKKRLVNPT